MQLARFMGLVLVPCLTTVGAQQTRLKPDESIIFYPTSAQWLPGQQAWQVEIRGCVFEPEKRGVWMAALREALDLKDVEMTPAEERIFKERARLFLADHERGKRIFIRFGDQVIAAGKSGPDGQFIGEGFLRDITLERRSPTRLNDDQVSEHAGPVTGAPFTAVLDPGDSRAFSGEVLLLKEEGLSVISDIDDTIKVTEVHDRKATLCNTFLREFQPVPGMAQFFQQLARSNQASFHYISASPWQLYEPLAAFVKTHGFPSGTFTLKEFRWKSRSFLSLFASPEKYKPTVIEPLLKRFPRRCFVLIGDSGERDPEIYAALAREFPAQVERIYIRDVTGEAATAERYAKAFRDVPRDRWQIFHDPAELRFAASP